MKRLLPSSFLVTGSNSAACKVKESLRCCILLSIQQFYIKIITWVSGVRDKIFILILCEAILKNK